ncbi:MAG TPA: 50S ribosomal protein L13 [Deltaproteobacteria bacterium]|nr:50S ribosomal protein L13 [Deltaproteobacteria bacterium]
MDTFFPKGEDLERKWYVVDAQEIVLGRLSARIASVLRGKHKPIYTPHTDTGDFVVVVNAEKIKLTGNKLSDKIYVRYSGYPGGLRSVNARTMLAKKPEEVIRLAVRGMLPKNTLGRKMLKKLKVYSGSEHPHQAQKPESLDL